jgi:lysophospholipase L1-like esterase
MRANAGDLMQIVIIGDSIAQGLGVEGKSYGELIRDWLSNRTSCEVTLFNFAGSAMQLSESKMRLPDIVEASPTFVIVAHGITEAIVRPTEKALRALPKRWRRAGWLDPRPYYSRRWWKCIGQKAESAVRWRVKVLLMRLFGGVTWGDVERFEADLLDFVQNVLANTKAYVILLTHCGIDERYFPGSLESLEAYRRAVERVRHALDPRRVYVCDVTQVCTRWDDYFDDHFHPNASGHEKIAKELAAIIEPLNLR